MPTFTALTTLQGEAAAQALADAVEALEPLGVGCFEIEDGSGLWEVGGYFDGSPDAVALALLAAAHGAREFAVSELPQTDWVAKVRRELAPVEAGRFVVHGSHDSGCVPEGRIGLLIEASMAFGTGHHGTTRGCLLALEALAGEGEHKARSADIGCGTAVLAMAAAHLWSDAQTVIASDIDKVAIEVAAANVAVNGLEGRVRCIVAAGFDHPDLAGRAPFDLVLANILKAPLISLAAPMAAHLAPGGHAILSGLLQDQADEVLAAYAEAGLHQQARIDLGEWVTLTLRLDRTPG